jgi:hypothetical protein
MMMMMMMIIIITIIIIRLYVKNFLRSLRAFRAYPAKCSGERIGFRTEVSKMKHAFYAKYTLPIMLAVFEKEKKKDFIV